MSFVRVSNRGRRRDGCRVDALEPRTLLATFLVTTSADDGPGSLRQAILDANATPGRDFISAYGRSVQPRSALPAITDPVDLIGPAIDGTDAGPGTGGLILAAGADGSWLRLVLVTRFGGSGIIVRARDCVLASCSVGIGPRHAADFGNGRGASPAPGVEVDGGSVTLQSWATFAATAIANSGGDGLAVVGGAALLRNAAIGGPAGGNGGHGISVSGGGMLNVDAPLYGSVFSGANGGDGIHIGPGSRPGVIRGASVGVAVADDIQPNGGAGLRIVDSAGYRLVGTSSMFNRGPGVSIEGPLARGNVMTAGTVWKNGSHGVVLSAGATGNRIGEPGSTGVRIGYNAGSGVHIAGPVTGGNTISGCSISNNGTAAGADGGAGGGVTIIDSDRNVIGGAYADRNTINNNRRDGITVLSGRYNRLAANSIYSNTGLAIDLGADGQDANDPGDADAGPNDRQNHPDILSAVWDRNDVIVSGALQTRPNSTVRIDLFADPRGDVDLGGAGAEGRYFVGTIEGTVGSDGRVQFGGNFSVGGPAGFPYLPPGGYLITATASVRSAAVAGAEAAWETSEYSPGVRLDGPASARVVRVLVNSTTWRPEFRSYLAGDRFAASARYGYSLDINEDVNAARALPWANLNEISIGFSSDVHVEQDDLYVRGTSVREYAFSGFTYDPYTLTATWRLARPIEYDHVTLDLASGTDGVRTVFGNTPLDGDPLPNWNLPSGDGTPGGDFQTHFDVYVGDANRTRTVDALDLGEIRARLNTSVANPGPDPRRYSIFHDLDGNGRIDARDLVIAYRSILAQAGQGTAR